MRLQVEEDEKNSLEIKKSKVYEFEPLTGGGMLIDARWM